MKIVGYPKTVKYIPSRCCNGPHLNEVSLGSMTLSSMQDSSTLIFSGFDHGHNTLWYPISSGNMHTPSITHVILQFRDLGSLVTVEFERISNLQALDLSGELDHELIINSLLNVNTATSAARLSMIPAKNVIRQRQ